MFAALNDCCASLLLDQFKVKLREAPLQSDAMMFLSPLLITLLLQLPGSDGNPSVTQSPAVKSAALGETVSLSCSASAGVDEDLSWYQQKHGQPPKLLFYKISNPQSDTPSHFTSSGSEPQFTLTINGVQADDAGDYYCMGVH
uniref:Ig-like domain-containing protein n=1 Tax=Poecilia formosa TaxID=48698 RepID=A0A096M9V6_POEFO